MNDTTRWIMIILLLLLIGAAVFMLLRKPGGDRTGEGVDTRDRRELDRDASGTSTDAPRVEAERSVYDQEAETAFDERRDDEDDRTARAGGVGAAGVAGAGYAASRSQDEPVAEPGTYAGESYQADTEPSVGADRTYADGTPDDDGTTPGTSYAETEYDPTRTETTGTGAMTDQPATDPLAEPYEPSAGADDGGGRTSHVGDDHLPTEEESPTATGTYDEQLFDDGSEDDGERRRQAAQIGALSAAGAGATVASTSGRSDTDGHDDATGDGSADVVPLTDEQVQEGARHEPLTLDEQEPLTADDYLEGTDRGESHDAEAERAHEAEGTESWAQQEPTSTVGHPDTHTRDTDVDRGGATEYPVGEETTYRAADGSALVVDDTEETGAHVDRPVTDDRTDSPFPESVYGPGSAMPAEDGSGPAGWEIKGNAGSMLFHTAESPSYDGVRAEVWFDSEESARAAGFAHWDRRRR
jgi:hypothetical protein